LIAVVAELILRETLSAFRATSLGRCPVGMLDILKLNVLKH